MWIDTGWWVKFKCNASALSLKVALIKQFEEQQNKAHILLRTIHASGNINNHHELVTIGSDLSAAKTQTRWLIRGGGEVLQTCYQEVKTGNRPWVILVHTFWDVVTIFYFYIKYITRTIGYWKIIFPDGLVIAVGIFINLITIQ